MVRPISKSVGVSFPYGVKYKNGVTHKGVDFSRGREGEAVYAALAGTVTHAGYGGWGPAYGQHVVIRGTFNGKTRWTLYGHLKTETVRVGQAIKAGQQIGTSGGGAGKRYSGNSTGPHLHFQVGYQNRYDRYENPWPIIEAGAPKPPKAKTAWFDGLFWNLAASDSVRGKATWDQRVPAIIKALKHYDRTVLQLVEAETSGAQGRTFAAALSKAGYKIAVADNQRMIAVKKSAKVGRTKVITLKDRGPANDDKQIVLAEITPKGFPTVVVECGHFEYRDGAAYDKVRVAQAKQTRAEVEKFLDECGLDKTRAVLGNDENSQSQVSTQAFGSAWPDIRTVGTYGNDTYPTLAGWSGKTPAKAKNPYRPDKVRVGKGRPVIGASTSLTFVGDRISDHLPVVYTLARI